LLLGHCTTHAAASNISTLEDEVELHLRHKSVLGGFLCSCPLSRSLQIEKEEIIISKHFRVELIEWGRGPAAFKSACFNAAVTAVRKIPKGLDNRRAGR
jgi:hypothetical protein